MAKFEKSLIIGKRKVDIVADNELSEAINFAALQACEGLLRSAPFIYIPHLRIKMLGKTDLNVRFLAFLVGLAKKNESFASIDSEEVIANHISELKVYLDVALAPIIVEHQQTFAEYLKNLENFDIPKNEKAVFIESLKESVVHEAAHIVHIFQRDFSAIRSETMKRLKNSLEGYAILESEDERQFLRTVREQVSGISVSEERKFVEDLFGSIRVSVRKFIDILFSEGIAVYYSTQLQYPFDSKFLEEKHSVLAPVVEDKVVKYFIMLKDMARAYSEKTLKKREYPTLPELDYSQREKFEETIVKMLDTLKRSAYFIGPYMVYTVIFGNESASLKSLMGMNSYQFIKAYEDACSSLGVRPLVSLTSGRGIFDYKRALEELLAAAQYMRKV